MTSASFTSLVKDYLTERYDESPSWASTLGLTEYDGRSDDLSAEAFRRREARVLEWTKRFRATADAELSADERIDRDVVLSSLRGRELTQPRLDWKRQPNTYLNPSLGGVFTLFLHRLRPERDLADAARARLLTVTRHVADFLHFSARSWMSASLFSFVAAGLVTVVCGPLMRRSAGRVATSSDA